MSKILRTLVLGSSLALARPGIAQDPGGWHFTKFDFPGAVSTDGYGISSTGEITGGYFYADGHQHGWRRTRRGTFTSIDFPGSDFTKAFQSNARGDLVGNYSFDGDPVDRHGYLLRDGRFTTFDPPGSFLTQPYGINDRGEITGRYCVVQGACDDGSGNFHGFLRTRRGEYITIDFPGGHDTACFKSNSRGDIVGGYIVIVTASATSSYLAMESSRKFTSPAPLRQECFRLRVRSTLVATLSVGTAMPIHVRSTMGALTAFFEATRVNTRRLIFPGLLRLTPRALPLAVTSRGPTTSLTVWTTPFCFVEGI